MCLLFSPSSPFHTHTVNLCHNNNTSHTPTLLCHLALFFPSFLPSMDHRPRRKLLFLFLFFALLLTFSSSRAQSFLGVNYGEVADNLPPPEATARLLKSTTISKVRLYGVDANFIRAMAGSKISLVIGASNGDIPSLATDPDAAGRWIAANVLAFPETPISIISVGNEVLELGDASLASQLLPAMQNLYNAAVAAGGAAAGVKISTVNTMAVLSQSDPPSSGAFHPELNSNLQQIVSFLQKTNSPFMINPYPYFAYQSDPRPETLAFCLFQPNAGRLDTVSKITYMNMFDAQLDAVKSALGRLGFPNTDIVVAETGWPYRGDSSEAGANLDNAKAYTTNLIAHLRSQVGTPLMPGKSVETYLFALYDEDLKPGPTSERSFGLFHPDMTPTFDAGLTSGSTAQAPSSAPPQSNNSSTIPASNTWCVPKDGVSDASLQADLDYACSQQGVDCGPIQPGGACYEPNTVRSHAAFAMNQLYQLAGRNSWNCDFSQSAVLTSVNPSYSSCVYPGGQ